MRKNGKQVDMYDYDFPKRLRSLLEGRTQQDIATAIGKSRQTVSYYANGEAAPDYETIIKLADYFQVTTDYLLGVSDIKTPRADIQAVCKYTGLSESAVENLHCEACGMMGNEPISALIEGDCFEDYHRFNFLLGRAFTSKCMADEAGSPIFSPNHAILEYRGLSGLQSLRDMASYDCFQLEKLLDSIIRCSRKRIPGWILKYYGIDNTTPDAAPDAEDSTGSDTAEDTSADAAENTAGEDEDHGEHQTD